MKLLISLLFLGMLQACTWITPHILNVQQGNLLESEALEHIQIGMHKSDIQRLLGAPLLNDIFHPNRMDYKFQYYSRHQLKEDALISFYLDNNERVIKIEGREAYLQKRAQLKQTP